MLKISMKTIPNRFKFFKKITSLLYKRYYNILYPSLTIDNNMNLITYVSFQLQVTIFHTMIRLMSKIKR